jgi:D-Ala-teichoic acid biosynthesis protein
MWTARWTSYLLAWRANPWLRGTTLVIFYLAILLGLVLLYGKGDFSTPAFIYQGF